MPSFLIGLSGAKGSTLQASSLVKILARQSWAYLGQRNSVLTLQLDVVSRELFVLPKAHVSGLTTSKCHPQIPPLYILSSSIYRQGSTDYRVSLMSIV